MLKYVYVSPSDFLVVLLGRGVARLAVGAVGAAHHDRRRRPAPRRPARPGAGGLAAPASSSCPLAWWSIIAIGLLLAGICLQTRQESWSYPEAMAGALFLVSGVVFPLSVLPTPAPGGRPPHAR